jgi:hypothetical protein
VRVRTVNIASGRDRLGRSVGAPSLAAAVAGLDADVLSVQELDTGQPRSHHVDRPAVLAEAFGALARRDAATVAGTPDPSASWRPLEPPALRGPDDDRSGPRYGIGLFCRRPVRRRHVLGLPPGRARLPVPNPRAEELVRGPTFLAHRPRLQVDHLLALGGLTGATRRSAHSRSVTTGLRWSPCSDATPDPAGLERAQ